jgi:hypothetical protein
MTTQTTTLTANANYNAMIQVCTTFADIRCYDPDADDYFVGWMPIEEADAGFAADWRRVARRERIDASRTIIGEPRHAPQALAADSVRRWMRVYGVTVRQLAATMDVTQKRVREYRADGVFGSLNVMCVMKGITGTDPWDVGNDPLPAPWRN